MESRTWPRPTGPSRYTPFAIRSPMTHDSEHLFNLGSLDDAGAIEMQFASNSAHILGDDLLEEKKPNYLRGIKEGDDAMQEARRSATQKFFRYTCSPRFTIRSNCLRLIPHRGSWTSRCPYFLGANISWKRFGGSGNLTSGCHVSAAIHLGL